MSSAPETPASAEPLKNDDLTAMFRGIDQAEELERRIGQQLRHDGHVAPADQLVGEQDAPHAMHIGCARLLRRRQRDAPRARFQLPRE